MGIFKNNYSIEKNIEIDSNIEKVWKSITIFEQKKEWSPWYNIDKKAKINTTWKIIKIWFKEEWNWKIIWSGTQTITNLEKNKYIEWKLEFQKPMKAHATNKIFLQENNWKVHVKWIMESSVPTFLFFMTPMIKSMVSMDFERWLIMLKSLVETWKVRSESESIWNQRFKWGNYIWVRRKIDADKMPEQMQKDFKSLINLSHEKWFVIMPNTYTIYNKSDIIKWVFDYTCCIPIDLDTYNNIDLSWTEFIKWYSKSFAAHAIRHTWSYKFLWNAWKYAYTYPKAYNIWINYKRAPIEIYITNPNETYEDYNIVDIYIPLR